MARCLVKHRDYFTLLYFTLLETRAELRKFEARKSIKAFHKPQQIFRLILGNRIAPAGLPVLCMTLA